MTESIINEIFENAVYPVYRGKQLTTRKVLNLGKEKYFWTDEEVPLLPIPYELLQSCRLECDYNCGLVNIYEAQTSISSHTDTKKGMDVDAEVYSVSFGITDKFEFVKDGTVLGSFWIGKDKQEIKSGRHMIFDGYNLKHRASTFKSKQFKYRLNITLRKKL